MFSPSPTLPHGLESLSDLLGLRSSWEVRTPASSLTPRAAFFLLHQLALSRKTAAGNKFGRGEGEMMGWEKEGAEPCG
jgi:hypothetical protein